MYHRSKLKPAVIKIKGTEADIDFLDYSLQTFISSNWVRKVWSWKELKVKFVVDDDGCYEILMHNPDDFVYIDKIGRELDVQIISVAYGDRKPDPRPKNKSTITMLVTYKGRTKTFNISTP